MSRVRPARIRTTWAKSGEDGSVWAFPVQVGSERFGLVKVGSGQGGSGQDDSGRVGSGRAKSGRVGPEYLGPTASLVLVILKK